MSTSTINCHVQYLCWITREYHNQSSNFHIYFVLVGPNIFSWCRVCYSFAGALLRKLPQLPPGSGALRDMAAGSDAECANTVLSMRHFKEKKQIQPKQSENYITVFLGVPTHNYYYSSSQFLSVEPSSTPKILGPGWISRSSSYVLRCWFFFLDLLFYEHCVMWQSCLGKCRKSISVATCVRFPSLVDQSHNCLVVVKHVRSRKCRENIGKMACFR